MSRFNAIHSSLLNKWWNTETEFPNMGEKINKREKLNNQKALDQFLDDIEGLIYECFLKLSEGSINNEELVNIFETEISTKIKYFTQIVFKFQNEHFEIMFSLGFFDAVISFINKAKEFDQKISVESVFQSLRNVGVMYLIQNLLNLEIKLTPSIFAYSLLYSYTDNYLDSPDINSQEKLYFIERLEKRLKGFNLSPVNSDEQIIYNLIELIERQYDRTLNPLIYSNILLTHNAQKNSIYLHKNISPYELDVLGITFQKGGSSVLTDGYLVAGLLHESHDYFLFAFGVFLQLIDDLEDVVSDKKNGENTLFTITSCSWKLDKICNRTINFGQYLLELINDFDTPHLGAIKDLIKSVTLMIIIDGIVQSKNFYNTDYINNIECYSPFYVSFIKSRHPRFYSLIEKIIGIVEFLY